MLPLQVGDRLPRVGYDPLPVHQHGDGPRAGDLFEFLSLLCGGRDVDYLVVDAELGELGADAVGEGAPLCLATSKKLRLGLKAMGVWTISRNPTSERVSPTPAEPSRPTSASSRNSSSTRRLFLKGSWSTSPV